MWLVACAALTPSRPIARRRSVAEADSQRSRTPTATFTPHPHPRRFVAPPRAATLARAPSYGSRTDHADGHGGPCAFGKLINSTRPLLYTEETAKQRMSAMVAGLSRRMPPAWAVR